MVIIMEIKNLPVNDRPRERFDKFGVRALADYEIMAIILGSGYKDHSIMEIARNIVSTINISDLENITIKELEKIKGIGHIKAMKIMASLELARRANSYSKEIKYIKNANDIYKLLRNELCSYQQEHFMAIYLDAKCGILSKRTLFVGTLTMTVTHPREIFKYAVKESACGFIIVHNHPTGISNPSNADIEFTKKIYMLGKEMQIELMDHIIIGKNEFYSFKEHNVI